MGATVRPAAPSDFDALSAIMGDTPSDEQIGISGNKRRARIVRRKLNEMLFRAGRSHGYRRPHRCR